MSEDRHIIQMQVSKSDDGELRYTSAGPARKPGALSGWALKILGIALGVAIFLLLIFFFVYVIVPLILIGILYSLIVNIFRPRR
ncbi:MAG: hypothetical protein AUJ71_03395 [Candidatus Omnitrophica bacterium CG1_02_49_16]|nr:MAG: hypothetical protein AUJ71_03395 [Candidatus Omnitrophica bacterium CG1_02_49_16]